MFWSLQLIGVGFVAVIIMARGLLERFFVQEGLAALLTVTSFVLYLQAAGAVPRALLVRRLRLEATARARIGAELAGGVVGIWMALTGHGVWSLVWMRLVSVFVETSILWRKARWMPRAYWSRACFAELWRFSATRGLAGLVNFATKQIPRFALGRVAGAAELGYFVFARRVIEVASDMLQGPLRSVAMPTVSRLQDSTDDVRRLYRRGLALTTVIVFPVLAGCGLAAPALVPLVVGKRWLAAVPLVQLFALNGFRRPFNTWNGAVLRGLGKPEWLLASSTVRAVLTVGLIFLLLPYRAFGVALAILLGTFLSLPVAMALVAKLTGLGPARQLRQAAPAVGATTVMATILLALQQLAPVQLSLWAVAVAGVVLAVGAYLAALTHGFPALNRDRKGAATPAVAAFPQNR